MSWRLMIMLATSLACSNMVHSHGESKPGPHGGHVRMPGKFHTELVLDESQVKIYLLDMQFKHPMTSDSSVKLELESSGNLSAIHCEATTTYFNCPLPRRLRPTESIVVHAQRDKAKGRAVRYALPLSFKEKKF